MIGKKIFFRALEPADIDILYEWENDTSVWHISNTITPFSRFALEQYILNSNTDIYTAKQLRLMINKKNNNDTIGAIDLFDFNPHHQRAGVGLLIKKSERNKGYADEALDLLADYAFNTLQLHQLYCNISSDNEVSLHLFQKKNFKICGRKKEWLKINNTWIDEFQLQLLNTGIS